MRQLLRLTQTQAQFVLQTASKNTGNDVDAFSAAFLTELRKSAPDFHGPVMLSSSAALKIAIVGPLGIFFTQARERVRKFEPLTAALAWSDGVHVMVSPEQIDAPDIEKIVVQRNGTIVQPVRTALEPREMVTRMGAKQMIHSGEVVYAFAAFEPGPGVIVTVIAVPATGSNIVRKFNSIELRGIQ